MCWLVHFQGTCNLCYSCVFLTRPHSKFYRTLQVGTHEGASWTSSCRDSSQTGNHHTDPRDPEASSCHGYASDCVVETLMVSMIFLRTQIGEPQIWADWKHSRLLPLVMPALSEPEKALWWLLFQFLRFFFFCTLCWTGIEG